MHPLLKKYKHIQIFWLQINVCTLILHFISEYMKGKLLNFDMLPSYLFVSDILNNLMHKLVEKFRAVKTS